MSNFRLDLCIKESGVAQFFLVNLASGRCEFRGVNLTLRHFLQKFLNEIQIAQQLIKHSFNTQSSIKFTFLFILALAVVVYCQF